MCDIRLSARDENEETEKGQERMLLAQSTFVAWHECTVNEWA